MPCRVFIYARDVRVIAGLTRAPPIFKVHTNGEVVDFEFSLALHLDDWWGISGYWKCELGPKRTLTTSFPQGILQSSHCPTLRHPSHTFIRFGYPELARGQADLEPTALVYRDVRALELQHSAIGVSINAEKKTSPRFNELSFCFWGLLPG